VLADRARDTLNLMQRRLKSTAHRIATMTVTVRPAREIASLSQACGNLSRNGCAYDSEEASPEAIIRIGMPPVGRSVTRSRGSGS
jgi:hypothetical protein